MCVRNGVFGDVVMCQGRGSAKDGGEFLKINRPYKCLECELRFCTSLQVRLVHTCVRVVTNSTDEWESLKTFYCA